jgi:hypothetical protein
VLSGEAASTNFIVLGLSRTGFEPMIYHIQGEHANHYTTNAGKFVRLWLLCANLNILTYLNLVVRVRMFIITYNSISVASW